MDKLKMHTPNKVDENVEKIGSLFPKQRRGDIKCQKLENILEGITVTYLYA